MNTFKYLFRFCCDPLHNRQAELGSVARFAHEMTADDVMVFCNVQELNTGHTTPEEQDLYLSLLRDVRAVLPEDITMSVNQWHSVMHMDQGKGLRLGQAFRLMRDPQGREATLCVCPACDNWQAYIAALYARYAQVQPYCLWVEDDFRFHNHDPLFWGGCFCDAHMARFRAAAGEDMSREAFVAAILQPGTPHPWRRIWLDSCRQDLLTAAAAIGQAVETVCPGARVGLMSSLPQLHAAEGRDWPGILRNLAHGLPPVLRIHLPTYSEMAPGEYMQAFNQISMLNRAFIPADTEVYPELENYPYSLYTKSRAFTRFQMLSALPLDLSGMTIDLFDLNGSGIHLEEGWQQMLSALHPVLNRLKETGVFGARKLGVYLLVSPNSTYTLHTRHGLGMEELYPSETLFGALFGAFGISFMYTVDPLAIPAGSVLAVCGQVLRNFDAHTIERLMGDHFVLLDGDAAFTLHDMQLGHLAGITDCAWVAHNSGQISYEQVEDGGVYDGIREARASAIVSCCDVLSVQYDDQADVQFLTGFYGFDPRRVCHGQALTMGRAYIFPFGGREHATQVPPMLLNSLRAALLAEYIPSLPKTVAMPHVNLYAYEHPEGMALYAVNASMDAFSVLRFSIGSQPVTAITALGSRENAEEVQPDFCQNGSTIDVRYVLNPMETVLLILRLAPGAQHRSGEEITA